MFSLPTMAMGKKLDLSKLSDEEAQHVWQVVQRDFDLRKKEEDRLGDLKTKIEKEDTKLELLGTQSSLTESHCIRCLHPFKFLVNSKRQCLDCQLHTCQSCSSYNKKERGWVCDPCRMVRVLKIGTLEWFHENVRSRFKRFGSAKVMRSLFKRLNGELSSSHNDLRADRYEEHGLDVKDGGHYRGMKKTKKLLAVHPFDFDLDPNYSSHSRRQSYQSPQGSFEGVRRESMIAEAEIASMFQQIMEQDREQEPELESEMKLHENHRSSLDKQPRYEDGLYSEIRPVQLRSLSRVSHSSAGSGSIHGNNRVVNRLGPDDSEEEEEEEELSLYPPYQSHPRPHSQTSQDSLTFPAPPQITELNRRMSAIETLLNRLEQKVTTPYEKAAPPQVPVSNSPLVRCEVADLEEQQLRQKLDQLTGNISDHGLTSEDEEPRRPESPRGNLRRRSLKSDANHARALSRPLPRTVIVPTPPVQELYGQIESQKAFHSTDIARKGHHLDSATAHFKGSTALLFELEDKVAEATASVQNTLSEVTDIENRIAALSAAGMTVEKGQRKSTIPLQTRRLSDNFPTSQADIFLRNSLYRGSLTQRSPVGKPKSKPVCAV
ncbi:melanophilin [Aplochiton taeniatus]